VFETLEDGEYAVTDVTQMPATIQRSEPLHSPMLNFKCRTFNGKRLASNQHPNISLLSRGGYPNVSFLIRSGIIVAVR
jgi:hypothetical protein